LPTAFINYFTIITLELKIIYILVLLTQILEKEVLNLKLAMSALLLTNFIKTTLLNL